MKFAFLISLFIVAGAMAQTPSALLARPPQYVMLAFDGSLSGKMWDATRGFSSEMKSKGVDVRFTYFISGVYFLSDENRTRYQGPQHRPGASAIGFGGKLDDVVARAHNVNLAFADKHEIGSHANGHFDGSPWTEADWTQEFQIFNQLVFNFFGLNGFNPKTTPWEGWQVKESDVIGFRAPVLGVSDGLYTTLKNFHFKYDTSKTSAPDRWPSKSSLGTWNFPLASLTIAGTAMHALSMDYNFYVVQTKAKPDPEHSALYEKQMYDTYLNYFSKNYSGNRAPIHIGHHFSLWNGGAYWRAMTRFASSVCGLPEVKCVTYKELTDYMESLTPSQLANYAAGRFAKAPVLKLAQVEPSFDARLAMSVIPTFSGGYSTLRAALKGSDAPALMANGAQIEVYVDGVKASSLDKVHHDLTASPHASPLVRVVEARVTLAGKTILRQTQNLMALAPRHKQRSNDEPAFQVPEQIIFPQIIEEDRALEGDLPEAHIDELND